MLNSCSEHINAGHINHAPKESIKKSQTNYLREIAFLMRLAWEDASSMHPSESIETWLINSKFIKILKAFGTLSSLRLHHVYCLWPCLTGIPNTLRFVIALDILERSIAQPHAVVVTVIGFRTGFGELFHAIKK